MKTFSVNTTNVRLTGNIKIVVDTADKLYIESINSSEQLSFSTYKGFEWAEHLKYGANIRNFCAQFTNLDVLFDVKDESSVNVNSKLSQQYHELYHYGCQSEESQLIQENFRFFAPIHVGDVHEEFPDKFVILKMSGNRTANETTATWFNEAKVIQVYDLAKVKKHVFDQIEDSYVDMSYVDVLAVNGLNLKTGLTTRQEEFTFTELTSTETVVTEVDNWLTNCYKRNSTVYSRLVNLEFAFTDKEIDNRFVRYAGFYVKSNVTTKQVIDSYAYSGALRLFEKSDSIIKWENSITPSTWDNLSFSVRANGFAFTDKRELFELTVQLKPQLGAIMQILLNDEIEHEIVFSQNMLGATIADTIDNIVNDINLNYRGSFSSVKAINLGNNRIRLESNTTGIDIGELSVIVPQSIVPAKLVWSSEIVTKNIFRGSNSKTLSVNAYYSPDKWPKIAYYDRAGQKRIVDIVLVHKWKGDWFYELSETIDHDNKPDTIWFVEIVDEKPILCSIIDHYELDMSLEQTQYADVLDFDINLFKQQLLATINDENFVGSVVAYYEVGSIEDLTLAQITAYKEILLNRINEFFNSIELNNEYLLKDINLSDFEATTCKNEYDRLNERTNSTIRKNNKLYQFVAKWSYLLGKDVYHNDYRLNISLPFRFDNFAPSINDINRDLRYHTHSWFIIGEGSPEYWNTVTDDTIKKLMSYTRYPVTEQLLASNENDIMTDTMRWSTDSVTEDAWSMITFDKEQNICQTFFKGVYYKFETQSLAGYRFATVLKSSEQIPDDVIDIALVRNDEYKTLVLYIKFYIPDPILTTVERSPEHYYLDRSLLYFSNEIYSTISSAIDFGTDRISLKLYDTSTVKNYLGNPVTTNWFYELPSTEKIIFVSKGDTSIFSTNLNELLTVGQNFTIKFTSSDDINTQWFGMTIEFVDIVEVQADYFWCKSIIVRHNDTIDPEGENDLDVEDNIVQNTYEYDVLLEFLANSNIFNENNAIYISRAVAYENCFYNKIVSSIANNSRYKELSLANVKNRLNANPVKFYDEDAWLQMSIANPVEFRTIVKLYSNEQDTISELTNAYTYPMSRYAGLYVPQFKQLTSKYDTLDFSNLFPANQRSQIFHKMYTSSTPMDNVYKLKHETYTKEDFACNDNKVYSYVTSSLNNVIVQRYMDWIVSPAEFKGIKSLVFNSDELVTVTVDVTVNTISIDFVDLLKSRALQWIRLSELLNEQDKLALAQLYAITNELTLSNVDVERLILTDFIQNVFLKIYRIASIKTTDGKIVQFNITDTAIELVKEFDFSEQEQLTIQFTR